MPKLKPCPFCGGERPALATRPVDLQSQRAEWVYLSCTRLGCGAEGPAFLRYAAHQNPDPEVQAVNAWNKRAAA